MKRILIGMLAAAFAFGGLGLGIGVAAANNDDNRDCPPGWAVQSTATSTGDHEVFDRNGDGLICSKGNETLPGNAGPPNGQGNTHLADPESSSHVHKDNNQPSK